MYIIYLVYKKEIFNIIEKQDYISYLNHFTIKYRLNYLIDYTKPIIKHYINQKLAGFIIMNQ